MAFSTSLSGSDLCWGVQPGANHNEYPPSDASMATLSTGNYATTSKVPVYIWKSPLFTIPKEVYPWRIVEWG